MMGDMMRTIFRYILVLLAAVACFTAQAQDAPKDSLVTPSRPSSQRRITPVTPKTNVVLPPGKDVDETVLEQFLTGDTLKAREEARKDSVRKAYTHYPKLTESYVACNFADLVMFVGGQDYFNLDFSFTVNMWNRIQPVAELGVGYAHSTPDDRNYTYKGHFAPYMKLGCNYNFMFKNSPDYQAFVGLRLGGSVFKYDITDIQCNSSYWGEETTTAIKGEWGRAMWGELVAGLKVKIHRAWALGWQVKFHKMLGQNHPESGQPWFVPGYGTRNGSLAFAFNVYYTFPTFLKTPMPAEAEKGSIADVK